jgi:hypothetical protein
MRFRRDADRETPIFMRVGKAGPSFIRFGKSEQNSAFDADKKAEPNFMRLGRSRLSAYKYGQRFGKRIYEEPEANETTTDDTVEFEK